MSENYFLFYPVLIRTNVVLVTSSDSNNTFTCNTVFSPHSTRKWYAKPFHKFLSNAQNVKTITCSENASLSVYFVTHVLIPCFVRSVTGKNERCGWNTWHTDHPWLSTFPCHCVFICLSFIWISQLNRMSLSEDLGKRLSHRCHLFMTTAKTAALYYE